MNPVRRFPPPDFHRWHHHHPWPMAGFGSPMKAGKSDIPGVVMPPPSRPRVCFFLFFLMPGDFGTIIRNSRPLPEAYLKSSLLSRCNSLPQVKAHGQRIWLWPLSQAGLLPSLSLDSCIIHGMLSALFHYGFSGQRTSLLIHSHEGDWERLRRG